MPRRPAPFALAAPAASIALAALVAGCATPTPSRITGFELRDGGRALALHTDRGDVAAPRESDDQAGFDDVQVSPDGHLAGWTATYDNCCTSYPLPLGLVIFDGRHVVRRLESDLLSIFRWHFEDGGASVFFVAQFPHGNAIERYRVVRVADGRVLRAHDCVDDPADTRPRVAPPAWTGETEARCLPD